MKKVLTVVSIASVMASTAAFALTFNQPGATNIPRDGVVKSKHNMNLYLETQATKDSEGRVCAYCHTPHHALTNGGDTRIDYMPLWSHKLTTQNYTPYFSSTLNVDIVDGNPLRGATALCMSCHDGVVAVDEHYNNGLATNKLSDDGFGGTSIGLADGTGAGNLGNDHPMGFLYSQAVTNHPGDINPDTTNYKTAGGETTKQIKDQLQGGFFTCATCHDVHNKDNIASTAPTASRNYFLLGDNNGSLFCLTCHNK